MIRRVVNMDEQKEQKEGRKGKVFGDPVAEIQWE